MATAKIRTSPGPAPNAPGSRRAHWQALVTAHERSGQTLAAFCQQRGLRKGTLSFWRWKFAREAPTAPRATSPPRFVPVQLPPAPVGLRSTLAGELEIALGPRRCVRVRGPVDPAWLTTVLRAVEALEC